MHDVLVAKKGYIYKWENGSNENYCLVISDASRSMDNLISILFLSTDRGSGKDVVHIKFNGQKWCVHADLITYTARKYLTQPICKVSDDILKSVETRIMASLGLENTERFYEQAYKDLLAQLVGGENEGISSKIQTEEI